MRERQIKYTFFVSTCENAGKWKENKPTIDDQNTCKQAILESSEPETEQRGDFGAYVNVMQEINI